MVTSLYLIKVLPASIPDAALKTMVMVGPSWRMRWIAMPIATTAARMGMSQIIEMRRRFSRTVLASGRLLRSLSLAMRGLGGIGAIPDQTWVERFGREHGEDHDSCEEQHSGSRRYRHQGLQLHERNRKSVDKHIEHRPSTDKHNESIEPRPLTITLYRTSLHADQQVCKRHQFAERNHHACDQHDQSQRPRSRRASK